MADHSNIVEALKMTMQPNQQVIKEAEAFLEKEKQSPGYVVKLMVIVGSNDQPLPIRQSALANLKVVVVNNWKPKSKFVINQEDKLTVRSNLLEALILSLDQKLLSSLYEKIIQSIIDFDFPKEMPNFLEQVIARLKSSQNLTETHGCLIALRLLISNYEFLLEKDRKPLHQIVPIVFPLLENLASNYMANYNEITGASLAEILKSFHAAIHLEISPYFVNSEILDRWMVIIKTLLDSPVPAPLEEKTTDEEEMRKREKSPYWKNKKWCGRILQRFIQKYGNPRWETSQEKYENKGLSDLFQNKYSIPFLESFLGHLFKSKTHFVGLKLIYFSMKYLFYSIRIETSFAVLQQYFEKILFDLLVPLLSLTPRDEELWNNDPEEYVRKEEDFSHISNNNKNVSMDLIEAICAKKDSKDESYLMKFINYSAQCMTFGQDPRTNEACSVVHKESLLWAFGTLKEKILADEGIVKHIETILEKHVLSEFKNPIGFLRARACWVFGKYGHIEFKNLENIKTAVEGIYYCLSDTQLPVRVKAAVSLNCLLYQKHAEDLLRPILPNILEIYLKLMDQIDNEGIVSALEGIVESYQENISPYAHKLTQHLCMAFHKYCSQERKAGSKITQEEDDDEDDGEGELAASGCLEAIRRILVSQLPQETYYLIAEDMISTFHYCFSSDGADYIEEALSCFNSIIYNCKVIPENYWFYFPILVYIVIGLPESLNVQAIPNITDENKELIEKAREGWGSEYIEIMMGSLKNFISKGGTNFLISRDLFGNLFIELVFKLINRVYEINLLSEDELDIICVTGLLIIILENHVGNVDAYVELIIDTCYNNIFNLKKSKLFKVVNLEVVSVAIWYNPKLTIGLLEAKNYSQQIFQLWLSLTDNFKTEIDKMRNLYGLASILRLSEFEIPPGIITYLPALMKYLVKLTSEILEQREKEETLSEADEDEDVDDPEKARIEADKTLKKINDFKRKNPQFDPSRENEQDDNLDDEEDDEDDDDEDYDFTEKSNSQYNSPFDEKDEILFFNEILQNKSAMEPGFYQKLVSLIDHQEQMTLSQNFENAKKQYIEFLKLKEEEKNKKK